MIAIFAQLAITINTSRLNNRRQFLIDMLNCDSVLWNVISDDETSDDDTD